MLISYLRQLLQIVEVHILSQGIMKFNDIISQGQLTLFLAFCVCLHGDKQLEADLLSKASVTIHLLEAQNK